MNFYTQIDNFSSLFRNLKCLVSNRLYFYRLYVCISDYYFYGRGIIL